ncbi:MAG: TetR/AcrR family transcriptional regulator, partial [Deltaproteobacteria bacterium]
MVRRIPEDRFDRLVDAAASVFIEQGYRRTQMADVAAAAGIAKGTLYLYVESKDALFDFVLRHADAPRPLPVPDVLPVPSPLPDATREYVAARLASEARLSALERALGRSGEGAFENGKSAGDVAAVRAEAAGTRVAALGGNAGRGAGRPGVDAARAAGGLAVDAGDAASELAEIVAELYD